MTTVKSFFPSKCCLLRSLLDSVIALLSHKQDSLKYTEIKYKEIKFCSTKLLNSQSTDLTCTLNKDKHQSNLLMQTEGELYLTASANF